MLLGITEQSRDTGYLGDYKEEMFSFVHAFMSVTPPLPHQLFHTGEA